MMSNEASTLPVNGSGVVERGCKVYCEIIYRIIKMYKLLFLQKIKYILRKKHKIINTFAKFVIQDSRVMD